MPTTEAPAITQLEEVVALEAELQAMRAEYDSLGAEISRLQAVRSDIAFAVTFHDKSREGGEPLVKRYNRVVRQAAADLLAERQLGWCLAGGHFCSETELSCAKAMFSRRSYDVKDGYEDHHKSVIAHSLRSSPHWRIPKSRLGSQQAVDGSQRSQHWVGEKSDQSLSA